MRFKHVQCVCSLIGFNSYFVVYLMWCLGNNPLYMDFKPITILFCSVLCKLNPEISGMDITRNFAIPQLFTICRSREWLTLSDASEKPIIKISVCLPSSWCLETLSINYIDEVTHDLDLRNPF